MGRVFTKLATKLATNLGTTSGTIPDEAATEGRETRGANIWSRVRAGMRAGADLLLPPLCLGCETRISDHDAVCPSCWRQIDFIRPPFCDRLGLPMPYDTGGKMISALAAAEPPVYDRARAVARHDGQMRELVHTLKFRDTHDARRLFGRWLVGAGAEFFEDADLIVPVPLNRFRLLSRRFNQAQILAGEVARLTGMRSDPLALVRVKATAHQVGLSRNERRRNVAGAFAVPAPRVPRISGKAIVLLDDVITTGATASAAAGALKKAGARRVDVLALALACEANS